MWFNDIFLLFLGLFHLFKLVYPIDQFCVIKTYKRLIVHKIYILVISSSYKQFIVKTTVSMIVKHDNIRIWTTKCTIMRFIFTPCLIIKITKHEVQLFYINTYVVHASTPHLISLQRSLTTIRADCKSAYLLASCELGNTC